MEKLSKFAISLGIGLGVTVFALIMISALPHMIENSGRDWDRVANLGTASEETLQTFKKQPAYAAMYEQYPDAKEEFKYNKGQRSELQVGVFNTENDNHLVLKIGQDYQQNIFTQIQCMDGEKNTRVSELFVIDYIQSNSCLSDNEEQIR